jgi:hypothetical protein
LARSCAATWMQLAFVLEGDTDTDTDEAYG